MSWTKLHCHFSVANTESETISRFKHPIVRVTGSTITTSIGFSFCINFSIEHSSTVELYKHLCTGIPRVSINHRPHQQRSQVLQASATWFSEPLSVCSLRILKPIMWLLGSMILLEEVKRGVLPLPGFHSHLSRMWTIRRRRDFLPTFSFYTFAKQPG